MYQTLKKYWGYTTFRSLQEEIITEVLLKKDVLALLPTGGGKSICFQVPAMMDPGICIVVSPLVALMKDQVHQLQKRHIRAESISADKDKATIENILDTCINGDIKFLYVSPERLQTQILQEKVKYMNVNLLAIDEAHCISQWGYDFRPSYLSIAIFREILPQQVNVIALTATATNNVKEDIQEKLLFKAKNVLQKSFSRKNLAYIVKKTTNKRQVLINILQKIPGTAIVYVNTRKKTEIIAHYLQNCGISADYYHAGIAHDERTKKQHAWIGDSIRVIVATNAFGMGIDKPNVRVVVHLDLPTTLEAYYQEAGRAGRDEQKAYAIVLYEQHDVDILDDISIEEYPSIGKIKKIYQHLIDYYRIAVGSLQHKEASFDFDIYHFADKNNITQKETYIGIKKLAAEGLVEVTENFFKPSEIKIVVTRKYLQSFLRQNTAYRLILSHILRIYGGKLFTEGSKIIECQIAKIAKITSEEVIKQLYNLHNREIIAYHPQKAIPQIAFISAVYSPQNLPFNKKKYQKLKYITQQKVNSIQNYVTHQHRCREQLLLAYFGEMSYKACKQCDICRSIQKKFEKYPREIILQIKKGNNTIVGLKNYFQIAIDQEKNFLNMLQHMLNQEYIKYSSIKGYFFIC